VVPFLVHYITMHYHNVMRTLQAKAKAGRPRNPELDPAILSAAARQLGELGYARMSLEAVAAAAATTVPTLRRRYASKAELVAAVIGSLRVEQAPSTASTPRAHALAILENFHRNLRATPALAILGSLLVEEERHPELLRLFTTRLVEPRRALLRQALAAGDLPASADLDALTSMLIGSFYGRYVTVDGIPDDWPNRVLSAVWPANPASVASDDTAPSDETAPSDAESDEPTADGPV
jgi:AcrR family transcriptional regulator